MDVLRAPKAHDVPPFDAAHPRWEFVFQRKYAAYLTPIIARRHADASPAARLRALPASLVV